MSQSIAAQKPPSGGFFVKSFQCFTAITSNLSAITAVTFTVSPLATSLRS